MALDNIFSGGIIISSAGFVFTVLRSYKLFTSSTISFPKNSPVLWTTLLEALIPVFSSCFLCLLDKFVANVKTPYPLTQIF